MTQRALKKKSGSVRPFQQNYTFVGFEDDVWDTCTYTFGSQDNFTFSEHHRLDNPHRPPPPVAKSTVTHKSRSTDPQRSSSSSLSSSSTKSGSGRGGIFSLFKWKKNTQNSLDTRNNVIPPTCTAGNTANDWANPATPNPPVLHLKKTTVRNATGETEDHFAIVPADRLLRENKNASIVCSRGWESPAVDKSRERLSQLKNPVNEKVNVSPNNELYSVLFDKQLRQGGEQLEKRANRYILSEGEEVLESQQVEDDSGKGPSLVNSTSVSDESSVLNSLDISGYIEWEDEATHLAGGATKNSMDVKRRSVSGPYEMSLAYPPNGINFSTMSHKLSGMSLYNNKPHFVDPNGVPLYATRNIIYDTPSIKSVIHKRKVLKSSEGEFILMGPYESASSIRSDRDTSIYSSTMSLAKSREKFSSMPSLNVLDKESKKIKKIIKKQKKKEEKMEKEKEKQEKKERKKVEKEMRKSGQTLPRNWEYIKKPIETVYERPRTDWKLTPVPISLDEPIYQVPNKTGIHSKMVHYASTPDLQRVEQVYGPTVISNNEKDDDESDYAPRAVVLRKGPNGFGFVLRGAKGDSPGFRHPPNDAPAMQYLDTVDKGSVADKAGLKGGDFILEINGQNVTRASHEYVVNLIKSSGNTLTMNVLTVKPTERDQNWYVHQDGSMTLPHRRKQAPEPPQRDPNTSLSFSKAKSKSFAEGMAEIEKLDQTLAEYEVSDTPSGESAYSSGPKSNGAEMKTASIRAGYAKKRVSSVELENLCRSESPHKPEHLSPSEVRIKKYHKKQSNLEKSQSTPNLAQNLEEQQPDATSVPNASQPMYRTVASSGPSDYSPYSSSCSSGPGKYTQHLHPVPYMGNLPNVLPVMDVSGCRHSVAIGPNVQVNSLPSHARGKARPVAPPVVGQTNAPTKQPAPAPPPQVVKISTNKEQPVYASVINGAVNPTRQTPQENPYESSFRPGTVAMFGNKKPMVTQSSLNQVKLRSSKQNDGQNEKPAQHAMLVTADVHASSEVKDKQKRDAQQSYYEPEPDYDSEHEDDVSKQPQMINGNSSYKTVISVSKSAAPPTTNGYVIPPAPAIGANNPIYSIPQQMHSHAMPSALPPPDQISLGVGTPINMMPAKSPSSSSSSSYKSTTEIRAPTPPPAPPLPSDLNSQLIPPPPQFCPPPPAAFAKSPASETSNEFLSEIKRAAIERMNRSKDIDAKDKTQVEQSSKKSTPMDKNQAAILEAVAKRRTMLEQNDKDIVVNQIEAQIQKAKKIQSAKYYNSGNGVKKEIEVFSENKDLLKEKSASIPPVPASKPLKQAATVAKPSARPVAPTKPKVVVEKVQSKPPAPNSISTIAITSPTLTKDAKTPSPTSTLIGSKNATAEKTMLVEADKLKESVKTVTTSTKVSEKAKASETTKSNDNGTDSGEEDFLKKAEKARQRYLQRRSGGAANDKPAHQNTATPAVSTVSVTATNHKTVSSSSSTTITVLNANGEAEKMEQTSGTNKKIQKTNKTNLVQTKKTAAAPVMKPQLSNGNTKSNRKYIEIQSAGNLTAIDKIGNVSIKDRIASLQKQNGQQSNSPDLAKLITLKGVTTSHSHTDPFNSSDSCSTPNDSPYHVTNIVAPPPGFSDTEQSTPVETLNSLPHLQVLPAPLSELSISTVPPYDRPTDNLVPQDDSLSLISSLSTLSTLSTSSTEHPIEIVPPPPSGFEDKASPVSTDQGFEESFISPPPQFDSSMKNAASTKNSFRNKPVEDWFYVDVLDWLESVQMNQYKVNFANHCIDGKKLLNLKRNDYITLGVTQVGHRMNLERSIKKLAMATQQKTQH